METIQGNVTLKCGHEMCPVCYAMQSRVNNTCPYCRDVFAPEMKNTTKPQPIPIDEAESVVDETVREYYHDEVSEELVAILNEIGQPREDQINDIQMMVYCHIYQASMSTYQNIMVELLTNTDD